MIPVPQVQAGPMPQGAASLAGQARWFTHLRDGRQAAALTASQRAVLCAPRPDLCGLPMARPQVMGILNATPDSFSDGGDHASVAAALATVRDWGDDVDLIDIGGESTRPGAAEVPASVEIARVVPVIAAIRDAGITTPISIDTRKAIVADAALQAGAQMVNDVSAMTFDPEIADVTAAHGAALCLMHAQGLPETMQANPRYGDVTREVYDHLAAQIAHAVTKGIPAARIAADPGIGFGKTMEHNLALLQDLAGLHGLGVPLLLGVSRKRFIGTIGKAEDPKDRMPGSLAVALHAVSQGAQILRVHDVKQTAQALRLWAATQGAEDA